MNYEIVELKEKKVVGLSAVTSNGAPDMGTVIGGLWAGLYEGGVSERIRNKVNAYAIGLYSDYSGENYTVTVGNEVSAVENEDLAVKIIPAGRYAKFSVHGNMVTDVAKAWDEIWNMDLDRSFAADFEEYLNSDSDHADIDLYIALK